MSLVFTYQAEDRALPLHGHRIFETQHEAENFIGEVAVRHEIPLGGVLWVHGNARTACAYEDTVELPNNEFGLSVITILHELAHVVAPRHAGHGAEWLYWYTYLLRNEVGIMASSALLFELQKEAL